MSESIRATRRCASYLRTQIRIRTRMDVTYSALTFGAVLGLALVHLFAGTLRFLRGVRRSWWLSFAGGISVAYVFLHLLPDLAEGQARIEKAAFPILRVLQHHTYLIALLGLATFYGLERMAVRSKETRRERDGENKTERTIFWIHILAFALYNLLIGYVLVHRGEESAMALLLFFLAMALHFVVNDYGLREHHKDQYHYTGRWMVAAAVLAGGGVGAVATISEVALSVLFAFLAGGVVLNVLKEELPEQRKSHFGAFALGLASYAGLLLIIT